MHFPEPLAIPAFALMAAVLLGLIALIQRVSSRRKAVEGNALAETINHYGADVAPLGPRSPAYVLKAEIIHRRGTWRSFETVEYVTLE